MLWPGREEVTEPAVEALEQGWARLAAEHPGVPPELTGVDWWLVGLREGGDERDVSAADAGLIIEPSGRFTGRTGNSLVDATRRELQLRDDAGTVLTFRARDTTGTGLDLDRYRRR